jgi:NAD(P)H-nitrite reductase
MTTDPIVCGCSNVHRYTIETAILEKGLRTVEQIKKEIYFDQACEACMAEVQKVLDATIKH